MPAPTKICPVCGRSVHSDAPACPACGHTYYAPGSVPGSASAPPQSYLPSPPPRSSFGTAANGPMGPPATLPTCLYCHRELAPNTPVCGYCGADQRAGMYPPPPAPPAYPPPMTPTQGYAPPGYAQPGLPQHYPPPTYAPHYPPVAYVPVYGALRPPDDFEMFDLERQYRDAKSRFTWMLVLGLLLFMPLLIVACIDYNKMKEIKKRVALRGIHPEYWASRL